jgi:hypothetical protein
MSKPLKVDLKVGLKVDLKVTAVPASTNIDGSRLHNREL